MIVVRDLTKSYGDRLAVNKLNFTVHKGEVVGFLGPNGAGKTTTMKIITGFMAPTSGQVLVDGADVFEDPVGVKKKIGYLPEIPPVYDDMRVENYLRFVADIKCVPRGKITLFVGEALEKTNLSASRHRLIKNLSKGFRQRVGLAQALVARPEILILDEPTVGLDPTQVAEVRALIQSLRGHHTILLSTHILSEVQAMCQKVIIINRGQIIAEDTLDGLSKRVKGGTRLRLRVLTTPSVLADQLRKKSFVEEVDVRKVGEVFVTGPVTNQELAEVAKVVVESGAGLVEFGSEKMGLEDIFINITGGGLS